MKSVTLISCAALMAAQMGAVSAETVLDVSAVGAVKTPEAAVERVRALRRAGQIARDEKVTIRLVAGTYRLSAPLRLAAEDSHLAFVCANGSAELTASADPGRFTAGADGVWRLKLPAAMAFDQLFVNGRRATLARSPNREYYFMKETVYEWRDRKGELHNAEKMAFLADNRADLAALAAETPEAIANARIHVFWAWDSDFLALRDADAEKGVCVLAAPAKLDFFRWPKYQTRYILENFRGALDEPGEWFFDRKRSELLYLPRAGERAETATVEIPTSDCVLAIGGTAKGRVTDVTFENVAFGIAGFKFPKRIPGRQSAFNAQGAIRVSFAENVHFHSCRFGKCAGYALDFTHAVRNCSVMSSVFRDLGAGGVKMGGLWTVKTPDDEVCEKITVDDNVFLEGGRIFTEGTGILLAYARACALTHNEIKDFYYNGVNVGWTWGYGPTCVRDNTVAWNHIRDIGQAVQCDMAGIYTLGSNLGTVVTGNVIHDVYGWDYTGHGCEGLYTDEGSVGITFVSNLVYRTKGASYNNNYGNDTIVRNNIFADAHDPDGTTHVITLGGASGRHGKEPEGHPAMTVEGNILVAGKGSNMASGVRARKPYPANHFHRFATNLWWSADGWAATNRYDAGHMTYAEWRAKGFDAGSVWADPLFVDAAHGDYRLKKGSPAFQIGFREWDFTRAGARTPALRALAENHRTPPLVKPRPPKRYYGGSAFFTSFEPCKVGQLPGGFQLMEGNTIAVTDEAARSGKKCVKIVDRSGKQPRSYAPHLPIALNTVEKDVFSFRLSLKFDAKCQTQIDFRNNTSKAPNRQYYILSNLNIRNGAVTFYRDRKDSLAAMKPGVWYDLRWDFRFLPDGRTVYDFTVVGENGLRIALKDVSSHDDAAGRPTWFGIMSYAHNDSVLYLDDYGYGATIPEPAPTPLAVNVRDFCAVGDGVHDGLLDDEPQG